MGKLQAFTLAILLVLTTHLASAEQETEDVFASVVVLPAFKIDMDKSFLDFGLVNPGESITLRRGTYYNTVKCVSNKGREYHVKIYMLGEIIGPEGISIPASSVKWKVEQASGSGIAQTGWQEFQDEQALVYTSSPEDASGDEVVLKFQYKLDLPARASAGHYSLKVAYLLTDEP